MFIGTSLTAGFGLERTEDRFTDVLQTMADSAGLDATLVNAGESGDTSAGGLRRIEWVLSGGADVLVVELGANDGLRGQSVEAMRDNLDGIVTRARALLPDVRILLAGMEAPPNLGTAYTTAFRQVFPDLAEARDLRLVPFLLEGVGGRPEMNQGDGIHPNVRGHRRMAENVWPYLEPLIREGARAPAAP